MKKWSLLIGTVGLITIASTVLALRLFSVYNIVSGYTRDEAAAIGTEGVLSEKAASSTGCGSSGCGSSTAGSSCCGPGATPSQGTALPAMPVNR